MTRQALEAVRTILLDSEVLRPLTVLLSLALWTGGCAASPDEAKEPRLRVLPISALVVPVKPGDDALDWEAVIHAHLAGRPVYSSVYRQPSGPLSSIATSCSWTQSISVYIQVISEIKEGRARRPLGFSWSHTRIDPEKPVLNRFRRSWLMPETRGVLLYSNFLGLTERRRIDGGWILTVPYLGEEIYREEFELIDCDVPYAPDWYEDNDT